MEKTNKNQRLNELGGKPDETEWENEQIGAVKWLKSIDKI
jgi:hypothetical protein